MDDLPAFVEFLRGYRPPHFTGQHLFDRAAATVHNSRRDHDAQEGGRLPAGEIEDVLAYHLGTMALPRFMPNVRFTLDRIPILDQMLGMCLPFLNATGSGGLSPRGGTHHASNAEHSGAAWSEVTDLGMAPESSMPHPEPSVDILGEREALAALNGRPGLPLGLREELRLAGIISDAVQKSGCAGRQSSESGGTMSLRGAT